MRGTDGKPPCHARVRSGWQEGGPIAPSSSESAGAPNENAASIGPATSDGSDSSPAPPSENSSPISASGAQSPSTFLPGSPAAYALAVMMVYKNRGLIKEMSTATAPTTVGAWFVPNAEGVALSTMGSHSDPLVPRIGLNDASLLSDAALEPFDGDLESFLDARGGLPTSTLEFSIFCAGWTTSTPSFRVWVNRRASSRGSSRRWSRSAWRNWCAGGPAAPGTTGRRPSRRTRTQEPPVFPDAGTRRKHERRASRPSTRATEQRRRGRRRAGVPARPEGSDACSSATVAR